MANPNFFETVLNVPFNDAPGATLFSDFSYRPHSGGMVASATTGVAITSAFSKFPGQNSVNFPGGASQFASTFTNRFSVVGSNMGQIECFVRFSSLTGVQPIFSFNGDIVLVRKNAANQIELAASGMSVISGGPQVTSGPFLHIAIVQDNSVSPAQVRIYLEGTQIISTTSAPSLFAGVNAFFLGVDASNANATLNGQVCNLRCMIGNITYVGPTITVPTAPFDLTQLPINGSLAQTFTYVIQAGIMAPVKGVYSQVGVKVRDFQYGGNGLISGTTKIKGTPNTPVSRRVRLYNDRDGNLVSEQWSDAATGAYSFPNVATNLTYTVIAYDQTHAFRAVLADNLIPDPMP